MNDRFKFRHYNELAKSFTYYENPELQVDLNRDFKSGLVFPLAEEQGLYMGTYSELQQRTGLKDKNGKLIYEGDIVKIRVLEDFAAFGMNEKYRDMTAPVIYEYGGFFIEQDENNIFLGQIPQSEIEVIGNIYENKELLG